jgi:hypothetical protein
MKRLTGIGKADAQDILAIMQQCRKAMTDLQSKVAIKSIQYRQATTIIRELDEMGQLITGTQNYFLDPPHSTHL